MHIVSSKSFFSGKNKQNIINLSSAESAHSVVSVNGNASYGLVHR